MVIKQLLTITVLVLCRDNPGVQITSLIVLEVIFVVMIILIKPMEDKAENHLSLFNEILNYCNILFYVAAGLDDKNELSSLGMLSILLLSCLVNIFYFFYNVIM